MNIKKLAPWNWFKDEQESGDRDISIRAAQEPNYYSPLTRLQRDIDLVFERAFRDFGFPGFQLGLMGGNSGAASVLRPSVDIAASEGNYIITVEVPGVDEDNLKLELSDNRLTVSGEKKQESEHKDKDFHRLERTYGSFQRVLTLPADVDQDNIKADFNNGVLKITVPRRSLPGSKTRRLEIVRDAA